MKELKSEQIITRVTPADRALVEREAARIGLDTSTFIRMTLKRVLSDPTNAADRQVVAA